MRLHAITRPRVVRLSLLFLTGTCAAVVTTLPALSHETESTTTTVFNREIVRILNKRCVGCHGDRTLAFPLVTYEQTRFRARSIRTAALRRHMPPWFAMSSYGHYANDNRLLAREIEFIVSWVDGGGPRNSGTQFLNVLDATAAPPAEVRAEGHFDHWQLGEPDEIKELRPSTITANSPSELRRSVIDLGLTSDMAVRAFEFRPGDRRVVRAATFTLQETGQWLGSWTPWYGVVRLPKGTAFRLPASSHIVAEVLYQGTSEAIIDRGLLGLYRADAASVNRPSDLVLNGTPVDSGFARLVKLHAEVRLDADTHVLALNPQVTSPLRSLEVAARRPDGGTDMLLFVRDVNPAWPTPYVFAEPVSLPKGTVLGVTAYTDGTSRSIRVTASQYQKTAGPRSTVAP